jgi:probable HAF family extracellular repeat protein
MRNLATCLRSVCGLVVMAAVGALLGACGGGGDSGLESLAAVSAADPIPRYRVTELSPPAGFTWVMPTAINELGEIAGHMFKEDAGGSHAFLFSGGVMKDLGTLGGSESYAFGLNNRGQVVGWSYLPGDQVGHAFLYDGATMQDLGSIIGENSAAYGINDRGQITGDFIGTQGEARAYLYSRGELQDLGTVAGWYGVGIAINDRGQIAGYESRFSSFSGFIYSKGVMQDLGSLGWTYTRGNAINNRGQVTGVSELAILPGEGGAPVHAFLYSDGVMSDLGTLGGYYDTSSGEGINDRGQVTGFSSVPGDIYTHAFLYTDGAMLDLNELLDDSGAGWHLGVGYAINERGQIVGLGDFNGETQGVLLTPVGRTSGSP